MTTVATPGDSLVLRRRSVLTDPTQATPCAGIGLPRTHIVIGRCVAVPAGRPSSAVASR